MTTILLLALLSGDALPTSLADEPPPKAAFGVHLGYLRMSDADDGTEFYGVHLRLYLADWLAVEGSVDIAQSDFADDDAELTLMPVQATGILLPFPRWPLRPYGLAGAGWYYTDVDYSGSLAAVDDDHDSTFGVHLGFGAELRLGGSFMLHGDFRYTFLDEPGTDNSQLDEEEFDFWQFTVGASLTW